MRRHLALAAGLVAAALVAATTGCSDHAAPPPKPGKPATWRVCTDAPYAPFEVATTEAGRTVYSGFDIEVLQAVAKARNARLDIHQADFDTILRDVQFGRCDVAASAIPINRERRAQVAFAPSYFDADQSLLVRRGASRRRLADLEGATVGVESGTVASWWLRRRLPTGAVVRTFPDAASLHSALGDGTVDAVVADLAVNTAQAKADRRVALVERLPTGEHFGFAVAKEDDDLRKQLAAGLAAIRADGTYDRIYRRHFPYPEAT